MVVSLIVEVITCVLHPKCLCRFRVFLYTLYVYGMTLFYAVQSLQL